MPTMPETPAILLDLARTRVAYEGGKFLMGDVIALPRETKAAIVAWAVACKHPACYEPTTTESLIALLAREIYAASGPCPTCPSRAECSRCGSSRDVVLLTVDGVCDERGNSIGVPFCLDCRDDDDQKASPVAWVNDIGGGVSLHCDDCHAGVMAEPDNAEVEFWTVPLRMVAADRVCDVCQQPFHPSFYVAACAVRNP